MFGIFSRRSGKRNFHAARMKEVSMRSFASAINKPMLFQIGDELPNLARHMQTISSKAKTSRFHDIDGEKEVDRISSQADYDR